jgi:hypothetical protein
MIPRLRCHLILSGAFFLLALSANAQQAQVDTRELIVQVPGIVSTRGFPEIKTRLAAIPGVRVVAFCESQQLLLIKVERKKLADNRPVFEAISELGFKFYLKEGATIANALKACKDKKMIVYDVDDLPAE